MKKSHYVTVLAASLLLAFALGTWARNPFAVQPVAAQSLRERTSSATQWEYCMVQVPVGAYSTGSASFARAVIYYPQEAELSQEKIEAKVEEKGIFAIEKAEKFALGKAMTKLGKEGWELTGEGDLFGQGAKEKTLYFKRPKH